MDSTLANLFSPYEEGVETFHLAGREIAFPMRTGAASMLYYGQRLYNFPLGVFAIALATVIFPELSRYAHRGDTAGLGRVASHGLRLTIFVTVPAALGLALVCEPLLSLWLEHGRFAHHPEAVARAAWVTRFYAMGIWAYSANHILVRAFYASEDTRTPLMVAVVAAGGNFGLNLALLWPMAERGLALATALSAFGQFAVLALLVSRRLAHLETRAILATTGRTLVATAAMAVAASAGVYWAAPALGLAGRAAAAMELVLGVGGGLAAFFAAAWALRMQELKDLLARPPADADADAADRLDPNPPAR